MQARLQRIGGNEQKEKNDTMNPETNYAEFEARLRATTTQVTRSTNRLPIEDLSFHRTSSSQFSTSLDEESNRILSLTNSLLKAATRDTEVRTPPTLRSADSVDDHWHGVVDVIDALLERADACFDEFTGVIKKLSPSQQEQGQAAAAAAAAAAAKKSSAGKFPTVYDYGPSKIPKPQVLFARPVDNSGEAVFQPLLKSKPHAIVPLEESVEGEEKNPYETEIKAAKYPSSAYAVADPIEYLPFESTKATFVDSMDGVMEMLAELKTAKEIAIDLEHHDVHSYHGLVSLMQISTREKDWVVDTLKPWRDDLQVLNEVFADPEIIKVFHGASMDIIWLQRDLGLYVVGLFDTYHASCALELPRRSLKFLLHRFVDFEADKRYQMADWRIRPLPEGMFDYARSDTHYLLYIFDHLRNELISNSTHKNNLIDYVLEHSKTEALQRYERPVYDAATGQGPGGWYDYLSRNSGGFNKEQFAVFRAVHQWRDEVAREEDEGVQCVFPKHMLYKLATVMPMDMRALYRTLSPMTPITKNRSGRLLEVIKQAKAAGVEGPEWRDFAKPSRAKPDGDGLLTPPATDYPTAKRYERSQFWGGVLDVEPQRSITPDVSVVAAAEALRLSLPLPPMPKTVAEVKVASASAPASESESKPESPTPITAPAAAAAAAATADPNEPFTVKELGGRRKRKAEDSRAEEKDVLLLDAPDDDDSTMDPESKKELKRQRRRERKMAKSGKPGGGGEGEEGGGGQEENKDYDEPFNYETADSVLNAKSAQPTGKADGSKAYNPYAKATEAPSAARKGKRMTSGKTLTFR